MENRNNLSKILYFLVSVIFLIGFNLYFSAFLSVESQVPTLLFPGVKLHYMENTGAAFSILQEAKMFLIIFGIVAILLIIGYVLKNLKNFSMLEIFMTSLLISGIGCNLYERIVFGFVRDYFELLFVNFPVFNISDMFINVSVIVIMYLLFTKKKNND